MCPLARVAAVAAVEEARELQPPVPAARRLEQVAPDRPHRAQLRRGRQRAGLPERLWDLAVGLELCERRSRTDPATAFVHPARYDSAQLDQCLGLDDPVAQERDEIGAACERDRAVSELGGRAVDRVRPEQLQASSLAPAPPRAREASPPG